MEQEKKVLIIEDDLALQDTIANLLSLEGFLVYQAKDGNSGIEMIKTHQPHIIICDIMMPGFTGLEVLKKLQDDENYSTIPFIFLTAKAELKDLRNGMFLGADDYITKPFNNEDLLQSINLRLNKKNRIIQNSSHNPKVTKQAKLIMDKLTKRERQIIKLLCEGKSCNVISKDLLISYHTVDSHRKNIERKIGVNSIASIVKFAVENGLSE